MWSSKLYIWYHGNRICGRGYQLLLSKYLRMYHWRRSRRQGLLTTKLAIIEGTVHWSISKNQQPPTVFLQDAKNRRYWIATRHYVHYRSNTNKLTFFQKVLVFSDGKQSIKPCVIVLLGILLLFCLDTNSSHAHGQQYRVQRSLAVEVLTRWMVYINVTALHPTFSLQAAEFIYLDTTIQSQSTT